MLQLRLCCENCQTELQPDSEEARICSFECTFCRSCVEGVLLNVCPNCSGGFERRPIRPKAALLAAPPQGKAPVHRVDAAAHAISAAQAVLIPPARR